MYLSFLIPLITTVFLNSCHPFTLPTQENSPYILPSHEVRYQMFLVRFSFSWETRIALPTGMIRQRLLIPFSPAAFTISREHLFAPCRGENTDHRHGRPSRVRQIVLSWHGNSSSPWQCDKGKKKKRNSNFNCGHFKNIISSYICILVPRSDNAGTDGCTVTIASMLHTLLGQTIPEEPAPEAFPQRSTHFYICSQIHTCTHTDFLNADSSPLPCAAYSVVLSI